MDKEPNLTPEEEDFWLELGADPLGTDPNADALPPTEGFAPDDVPPSDR